MSWVFLAGAIAFEVAATAVLRLSDGGRVRRWIPVVGVGYLIIVWAVWLQFVIVIEGISSVLLVPACWLAQPLPRLQATGCTYRP